MSPTRSATPWARWCARGGGRDPPPPAAHRRPVRRGHGHDPPAHIPDPVRLFPAGRDPPEDPMSHKTWHRNLALILPLLLVNSAAVWGQAGWAYDHLGRSWVVAALFALAVE